ncbi:MAG: LPD38 domain-containing protein, partial [Nanoarchaeota archaeon]
LFSAFSPFTDVGDILPTVAKGIVESKANYNFFTGYPIIPENKQNFPAQYQFSDYTAPIYRLISTKIADITKDAKKTISPAALEHLVGSYLTGYSRILGEASKLGARIKGDPDYKIKGQPINQIPVIRRLFGGEKQTEEEQTISDDKVINSIDFKINEIKGGINKGNIPIDVGIKEIERLQEEQMKMLDKMMERTKGEAGASEGGDVRFISANPKTQTDKLVVTTGAIPPKVKAEPKKKLSASEILREKIEINSAKTRTGYDQQPRTVNDTLIYYDNGTKSINFGKFLEEATGIEKFQLEQDKYTALRKLYKIDNVPDEQKQSIYKKLGVTEDAIQYDYYTNQAVQSRIKYYDSFLQDKTSDDVIKTLLSGRVMSLAGNLLASDEVISGLVELGLIDKQTATLIRSYKFTEDGKNIGSSSRATGGRKKTKLPKPKRIKVAKLKPITIRRVNFAPLKALKVYSPSPKINPNRIKLKE